MRTLRSYNGCTHGKPACKTNTSLLTFDGVYNVIDNEDCEPFQKVIEY